MEGEDQYMDDLFGEHEPVHNSPPAFHKGLNSKLEELHENGCCQKIDWSRNGCVASVSDDGHTVNLSSFRRSEKDASWSFAKPSPLQLPPLHEESQITHVSWNALGSFLAVIDNCGRISIYGASSLLGKVDIKRSGLLDHGDESSAVVCCYWLHVFPSQQKVPLVWFAARDNNQWNYKIMPHVLTAAHHPLDHKQALMCVTKSGTIRLLYQFDDTWMETGVDMETIVSSKETLTHADIVAENDGALSMATYDVSNQLRLHRVKINWNIDPKQPQPGQVPQVESKCIRVCEDSLPRSHEQEVDGVGELLDRPPAVPQLTHLKILPPAQGQSQQESSPATVMAVFTRQQHQVSLDQMDSIPESKSVLCRWEIHPSQDSLNSAFDQLPLKKKNTSSVKSKRLVRFNRLDDVALANVLLSIYLAQSNDQIIFCLNTGVIEFRNRSSLEPVVSEFKPDKITSLAQAGFSFPRPEPALNMAMSPNFCITATTKRDSTIVMRKMEYSMSNLSSDDDDNIYAIVAMVMLISLAHPQINTTEDLVAMLPTTLAPKLKMKLIEQLWIASSLNLDLTSNKEDRTKMMNLIHPSSAIVKILSIQHVVGMKKDGTRNLGSKFAWMCLNVRLAAWVLSTTVRPDNTNADFLFSIAGTVRWSLDLTAQIISDLLDLSRAIKGQELTRASIEGHIQRSGSPSLILILSSFARTLLRHLARAIRSLSAIVSNIRAAQTTARSNNPALQKAAQQQLQQGQHSFKPPQTVQELHAIQHLYQIFMSITTPMTAFEALVTEGDRLIQSTYTGNKITDPGQRTRLERDLALSLPRLDASSPSSGGKDAAIPDIFLPAIKYLLTGVMEKMQADYDPGHDPDPAGQRGVDPSKVYFADLTWLGLNDDKVGKTWRKTKTLDVNTKAVLHCGPDGKPPHSNGIGRTGGSGDAQKIVSLRKCARCGARSEDADYSPQNGYQPWVSHAQKSCICGCLWVRIGN